MKLLLRDNTITKDDFTLIFSNIDQVDVCVRIADFKFSVILGVVDGSLMVRYFLYLEFFYPIWRFIVRCLHICVLAQIHTFPYFLFFFSFFAQLLPINIELYKQMKEQQMGAAEVCDVMLGDLFIRSVKE